VRGGIPSTLTDLTGGKRKEGVLESYVVRIYRGEKDNPHSFVGIVEQVGVEEKRAFTNFDELWAILNAIQDRANRSEKSKFPSIKFERFVTKRRNEERIKKEIPFVFTHNERNFNANTVDFCKSGLCIRIPDKTPLKVGEIVDLQVRNSNVKAEVRWVDEKTDPLATMAGFRVTDGTLALRELKGTGAS
jgi:hypothetical protein